MKRKICISVLMYVLFSSPYALSMFKNVTRLFPNKVHFFDHPRSDFLFLCSYVSTGENATELLKQLQGKQHERNLFKLQLQEVKKDPKKDPDILIDKIENIEIKIKQIEQALIKKANELR